MSQITTAVAAAATLFQAIAVLGILVTGFFLGRSWLNRVDPPSKVNDSD